MMGNAIASIEPNASSIYGRMSALWEAHRRGLRTYAMFCPLLPNIACNEINVGQLVEFAIACDAEEIFAEPLNRRGSAIRLTCEALAQNGEYDAACGILPIGEREEWSWYVRKLLRLLQNSLRSHHKIARLRFLLYPSRLVQEILDDIRRDDEGVVWLGKK